jgi:hypothetical protein
VTWAIFSIQPPLLHHLRTLEDDPSAFSRGETLGFDSAERDDPDAENTGCEDDFMHHWGAGPGCPISDPGGGDVGDEGEQEHLKRRPVYGVDQSLGPING